MTGRFVRHTPFASTSQRSSLRSRNAHVSPSPLISGSPASHQRFPAPTTSGGGSHVATLGRPLGRRGARTAGTAGGDGSPRRGQPRDFIRRRRRPRRRHLEQRRAIHGYRHRSGGDEIQSHGRDRRDLCCRQGGGREPVVHRECRRGCDQQRHPGERECRVNRSQRWHHRRSRG